MSLKARVEPFVVVAACAPACFSAEAGRRVAALVRAAKPDYWQLSHPGLAMAYFRDRGSARARVDRLLDGLKSLRAEGGAYGRCGFARVAGHAAAEFDRLGRMKSDAYGDLPNQAIRLASADAGEGH